MRIPPIRVLAASLALTLVAATPQAQRAPSPPKISEKTGLAISSWRNNGIDHHNQMWLVRAALEGRSDGIILFATEIGRTPAAIRAITAPGGDIMVRFDEIGYFRARLPLKQFRKAHDAPGVLIALIDGGALTYSLGTVSYPAPTVSKA